MKKHLPLISITAAGLLLRLYNLTSISLWHDEAFSALLIRYSWGEMMHRIGLDVHPPMYYIFLRLWHYIFGNSLFSLRGFSVFFGVATILITYAFVKSAFNSERFALIAALLVAINPFQIQYVTEARMYTMGAFFAVLAAYFLSKALNYELSLFKNKASLNSPTDSAENSALKKAVAFNYIFFAASIAISILTHYYLLFSATAICFYALVFHIYHYKNSYRRYGWLIVSYILIILSFLPWLKIFLFQYKQVDNGYWIPPIDKWSIPTTIWQMLIGINKDIAQTQTQILVIIACLFSLYFFYKFLKRVVAFEKWLVVLCVIAPFAGSIAFAVLSKIKGQGNSVYLVRYFLFASTFYTIALAGWISSLRFKKTAIYFLIIYSLVNLYGTYYYWHDLQVQTKPGMSAAAKYLNENVGPKDKLYIGSSFEFFNFKYYNQTPVRPLLFTGGSTDIKDLPHYAGTAILTNQDLLPDFKASVSSGDTVWLLWTNGFGGNKPATPGTWTQIVEESFAEVRPYVGTYIYIDEYKVN